MTQDLDQNHNCPLCNFGSNTEGLCRRCHARLHTQLDDLLELWQAAHEELLPGKGGHGSAGSERTIGLNVAALSFIAGDDILKVLHEWEKYIRTERGLTPPALLKKLPLPQEIAAAVAFAQAHLEWSGTQEWIDDFAKELRDLHASGVAAARRFVERVRRIPCPGDTSEGLPCGNLLVVQDQDLLEVFGCRRCGTEWTSFRLIAVALSNPASTFWLDAEAIAAWMGLSERRVRQIAAQNEIARKGNLYDFKAIVATREPVA